MECVILLSLIVKIASAPQSGLSSTSGCVPPPHSSEKSTFVPSLLKVAECQKDMFESAAASTRFGFFTSWMSSSNSCTHRTRRQRIRPPDTP